MLTRALRDPEEYSRRIVGRPLRPYQAAPLRAILASILGRQGLTFSVMFARQMGKNELSAHLEAYLMTLFRRAGGTIVKAAPTFKPQIINSKMRLEAVLDNSLTRGRWRSQHGYIVRLGNARTIFFSGEPGASVVGATASLLLEIDEAQDFDPLKYQRDFRPMASTANATTVLYGTAWAEDDLLARQKQANLDAQAADGLRRHFEYDWTVLAALSDDYRRFVEGERERLGADHPLFVTQYALQPLPGAGRLLTPTHLAQLVGDHRRLTPSTATGDLPVVAGLDLAGEGPGEHDETVLTLAQLEDRSVAGVALPVIRIVDHVRWAGHPLAELQMQLVDLLGRVWRTRAVVVDATGLGAGVASFLAAALGPGVVEGFVFSPASKSRLGYALLSAISAGRLRMYGDDGSFEARDFWTQMRACRREIGPGQTLRFSVPAAEGHDDFVISAALCVRAAQGPTIAPASEILEAADVLGGWKEG